jgi:predicted DNA-binding protein
MLALSDAQRKANDKYIKNNYRLSMPKEEAETLDNYCTAKNCSKAGFIRQAIKEKMEREP